MPVTLPVIDSDGMGDANREGNANREGEVIVANPILGIHATAHQLGSEIDDEADANMMWEMSDEAERILRTQAMAEEEEDDDGGGRTAEEEESQEDEEMQEDDEEETPIWEDEFSEDFDIEKEFEDQFRRLPTKIDMKIWPEDELEKFKEQSWDSFKEHSPSAAKFIFDS